MDVKKINLSVTTCYLLKLDKGFLLIDTGYKSDKKMFYKKLSKLGISVNDIKYLLLTHCHDDHVGLVCDVIKKNPSCKVIAHSNSVSKFDLSKNDLTKSYYINKRVASVIGMVKNMTKGGFPSYTVRKNDIIISKDISFKEIGINLTGRIVSTKGHTDDSITVILDNGICLCGDAASNMLSFLGTKHCVIVLEDLQKYYLSWEKLIKDNVSVIYPAHGKPFKIESLKEDIYRQKEENLKRIEENTH